MEKTKIGISVALMSAIVCLLGYYGGYTVAVLVLGYVLLVEQSAALKRLAVKVLAVMLAFSLLNTLVGLIPDIVSLFRSLIYIFDEYFFVENYDNWLDRLFNFLYSVIALVKMVVFLLMGIHALAGKEVKVPVLDKALNKLFNEQEV